MRVQVLGQLDVTVRGTSILPTASKPRQVLAMLALNPGRIVTVRTLMEELWGTEIPRSAATTLQTYVMQLRRKLRDALAGDPRRTPMDLLVTHPTGYRLQVRPEDVDCCVHDRLVVAGRDAAASGDDVNASRLLGEALSLWQGPALLDVQVGPRLELEVMRLDDMRLYALEMRIEADLRLGRHQALLGELAVLTAEHQLHETLHTYYMIALSRSGRRWQALSVHQRLRRSLADELGIEPGHRIREVQRAILAAEPVARDGTMIEI
ncbi:BTAD domain-containing putative transcriptional regulator [Microbispora sp. NPDC049125]|uniref:AfsR/SARP family transcriptional regulator n=1 Tax=Microbispora sp. NPDC049125 TaxID=3154929 RepID=UPI0034671D42